MPGTWAEYEGIEGFRFNATSTGQTRAGNDGVAGVLPKRGSSDWMKARHNLYQQRERHCEFSGQEPDARRLMSDEERELVNEEGDIIPPDQPAPQKPNDDKDEEAQPIESYDLDHCTIQIDLQLLPATGAPSERAIVIGVRNHTDVPILAMMRLCDIGPLPQAIIDLLGKLRAEMPARQQAHEAAEAKKKADAEARAEAARQRAAQVRAKVAEQKAKPVAPAKKAPIVPDFGDDDNSQPAAPAAQASLLENV